MKPKGRFLSQGTGVDDAKILINLPGCVGFIERVEVDAADLIVKEVAALLGRPVDPDPCDGLIVGATVDGSEQRSREARSQG